VGRRWVVLSGSRGARVMGFGTGRWIDVLCCDCEYLEHEEIRSPMLNTLKRRIHEYV
jgi:hypothetical protein